jgi:hypothetical protein
MLPYCLMSNCFHVFLEAPPMPVGGISDQELLQRLGALYSEVQMAREMEEVSSLATGRIRGEFELPAMHPETGQPLTPVKDHRRRVGSGA